MISSFFQWLSKFFPSFFFALHLFSFPVLKPPTDVKLFLASIQAHSLAWGVAICAVLHSAQVRAWLSLFPGVLSVMSDFGPVFHGFALLFTSKVVLTLDICAVARILGGVWTG
jgi:hypothetical protein